MTQEQFNDLQEALIYVITQPVFYTLAIVVSGFVLSAVFTPILALVDRFLSRE